MPISDVNKTFMTRPTPKSRPSGQDQDQDFEMLLKQDQDQDLLSNTKAKTSEPKSRPIPRDQDLAEYDSDKLILQHMSLYELRLVWFRQALLLTIINIVTFIYVVARI